MAVRKSILQVLARAHDVEPDQTVDELTAALEAAEIDVEAGATVVVRAIADGASIEIAEDADYEAAYYALKAAEIDIDAAAEAISEPVTLFQADESADPDPGEDARTTVEDGDDPPEDLPETGEEPPAGDEPSEEVAPGETLDIVAKTCKATGVSAEDMKVILSEAGGRIAEADRTVEFVTRALRRPGGERNRIQNVVKGAACIVLKQKREDCIVGDAFRDQLSKLARQSGGELLARVTAQSVAALLFPPSDGEG